MEIKEKTDRDYLVEYLKEAMLNTESLNTESLVNDCPRKPTIYTILRHCSRSGMSRSISVYVLTKDRFVKLDYLISNVTDMKLDKNNGGVKIGGCGMDMGFSLVNDMFYSLSDVLGDDYKHGRWQSIWDHSWL